MRRKVRRQLARARACVFCVYDLHAQGNRRDAKLTTHTEILQGEHVLFGVVKWKLDARLRYLMYV